MRKLLAVQFAALALAAAAEDLEWKFDATARMSEAKYAPYRIASATTDASVLESGKVFDSFWRSELSSTFLRLITDPATGVILIFR